MIVNTLKSKKKAVKKCVYRILHFIIYEVCKLFPLQNKVVASTFKGKKYGDNPQYILEALHKARPNTKLYWLKQNNDFVLPEWITGVSITSYILKIYHVATAKVIIDTHRFPLWMKKRQGQLFIETWHGGLGIKKLEADVPKFKEHEWLMKEVRHTSNLADVFISQSDHLSQIYRRAFGYKGLIFKCGYPKNDALLSERTSSRILIRNYYNLDERQKLLLYAPTFRDEFYTRIDTSVYDVDLESVQLHLQQKFGGEWTILVRWHPLFASMLSEQSINVHPNAIDTTSYPDVQELLKACDAVMSDYSSIIFDAALLDIPCFIFATDFEAYKADRGTYYDMEELPFPYARNNEELMNNIENYDHEAYLKRWYTFKERMGLYEPGNASEVIANKVVEFIETGKTNWIN